MFDFGTVSNSPEIEAGPSRRDQKSDETKVNEASDTAGMLQNIINLCRFQFHVSILHLPSELLV